MPVLAKGGEAQIFAHVAQEIFRLADRIEDERALGVSLLQLLQQGVNQRRLAGADLAGKDDETLAGVDTVHKARKRLLMTGAQVEKTGIRGDVEGFPTKTEVFQERSEERRVG